PQSDIEAAEQRHPQGDHRNPRRRRGCSLYPVRAHETFTPRATDRARSARYQSETRWPMTHDRRASFVIRVVQDRRGQVSGIVELVATGAKEAFTGVEAIGRVISRMLPLAASKGGTTTKKMLLLAVMDLGGLL